MHEWYIKLPIDWFKWKVILSPSLRHFSSMQDGNIFSSPKNLATHTKKEGMILSYIHVT